MAQVLSHKLDLEKKSWWCSSLKALTWHFESLLNLKSLKVLPFYMLSIKQTGAKQVAIHTAHSRGGFGADIIKNNFRDIVQA